MENRPKILVLEDDQSMLDVLVEVLTEHGYDVTPATNGEDAVARAMESNFDLIVADIRMEGMSGLDAVEQSRQQQPEIGTLIVSGYTTPDNMARATQLQAGKILAKPFKMKDFLQRVEEQLSLRQQHQAKSSRAHQRDSELLWALNALTQSAALLPPDPPVSHFQALAEGMARSANLAHDVCLEVGLAAALASLQEIPVPSSFLENSTVLPTLKYCLARCEDSPEALAQSRLEARIVSFSMDAVTDGWKPGHPISAEHLRQSGWSGELLELYQKYLAGESQKSQRAEQEHLRSALSLAHTLLGFGRAAEARRAFQEVSRRSHGRVKLNALLGQAQLELHQGSPSAVSDLVEECLEEARGLGPVSYATTLLAGGLMNYQSGLDASQALREAIQELARLRFDGSVALAAIAMADLGHQPNSEKLAFFLSALVKPRYSDEVTQAAAWLVPASLRLLSKVDDFANKEAIIKLLSQLAPSVLTYLQSERAKLEEKEALLQALEGRESLPVASTILEQLALDRDSGIQKRAAALKKAQSGGSGEMLIRCRSFGVFQVSRGAELIPDKDWKTKKVRYYFAYLAAQWGQFQSDDVIMEHFWPNRPKDKAKQNLYWSSSVLRKCVSGDEESLKKLLERREESLRLNPQIPHWHDLLEFEDLHQQGRDAHKNGDWARARSLLSQMTELVTGPYLEGYHEAWAVTKREQVALRFREGLETLSQSCLELKDYSGALEAAQRLIDLDHSVEKGHELVMRSHIGSGNYTRAIQQYELCHKILSEEYGLEPSPELLDIYEQAYAYEN